MRIIALTLTLFTVTPSASTLAAVAVFVANAERKWPVDEREPAVTAEALRLLEAAGRAIADDWALDSGDVPESIADFASARAELEQQVRGDEDRPRFAREALVKGAEMIEALTTALDLDDAAVRRQLSALERSAEALDRKEQVRQQGEALEEYFHQTAELLQGLLDAPAPQRTER